MKKFCQLINLLLFVIFSPSAMADCQFLGPEVMVRCVNTTLPVPQQQTLGELCEADPSSCGTWLQTLSGLDNNRTLGESVVNILITELSTPVEEVTVEEVTVEEVTVEEVTVEEVTVEEVTEEEVTEEEVTEEEVAEEEVTEEEVTEEEVTEEEVAEEATYEFPNNDQSNTRCIFGVKCNDTPGPS